MMEFLKYFAPVALLTLIWTVAQFFIKRRQQKSDYTKEINLETYKSLHRCINSIKYEFTSLFNVLVQATIILEKRNESIKLIEIEDDDLSKKNDENISNLNELTERVKNGENSDGSLDQLIKNSLEKNNDLLERNTAKIRKNDATIKQIVVQRDMLQSSVEKDGENIFDMVRENATKLKVLVSELNSIPLISIGTKSRPNSLIYELSILTLDVINRIELEDNIDRNNILEILKLSSIEIAADYLAKIEDHIYKEMN